MKNRAKILGTIIFVSLMFVGCGQTGSKQKELELKERDLALKEKELALRETGLTISDTLTHKTVMVQLKPRIINSNENAEVKLVVNPLKEGGGFGQIGFSKNGENLFMFDQKSQKGKIILNGTEHVLTKCVWDGESSYKLTGNEVIILALNCKITNEGDCFHGISQKVTINLSGVKTSINNVEYSDCLSFSW